MSRISRIFPALGAILLVFIVAGCGSESVPKGDVMNVDGTTTSKKTYNRWVLVAAKSAGQGGATPTLDPPKFTKCVAAAKAAAPKPVKGQVTPTDAEYLSQCRSQYRNIRDQVMTFLIRAQWLESEAAKMGITVTDAEVAAAFAKIRRQQFAKAVDYEKYLKGAGVTEADLLLRQRTQMLEQAITKKVNADVPKVTDAEVQAYYAKNKDQQFTQPAVRDTLVVLTKDKATAAKAKAEIEAGASWASVAKKYSIDPASKDSGGKLAVAKGQGEQALDAAVFRAAVGGGIEGPVDTTDGWYIIRVKKETPGVVTKLDAALTKSLRPTVLQQAQQKALQSFAKEYQARWKKLTECAAGYIVIDCNNYKKPKKATTPATTQQGG
ncbi:unannotated protein [freshwater metagenome]|uniref:Unannotated protein n=1 Tax=freshwater metagenome TaxID=449393 RepID=A0A6J7EJQ8_9ZZZZ|nr:hypothetical protein [Actinomycetota bacterium]